MHVKRTLSVLITSIFLTALLGCDSDNTAFLPSQECINTAKTEMLRRGIDYDKYLQQEGEFSKYIWINDKLFIADETVPLKYATKIRLHNSYTHGIRGKQNFLHPFPGVDAVQKISLDKFKEANPEAIQSELDRAVPFMLIELDCDSRPIEILSKNETLDDVIIKKLYKRPDDLYVGLNKELGAYYFYSNTKAPGVYYVLVNDGEIDKEHPTLMCDKDDRGGTCDVSFMYEEGVRLSYTFPKAQLSDWVRLHDLILSEIDKSYQRGNN